MLKTCTCSSKVNQFTLVFFFSFQELRIAVSVALAVGPFLILWSPFFALIFTFAVCIVKKFKSSGCAGLMVLPSWILGVSKWLQYGHPCLFPLFMVFVTTNFGEQLSRACCVCAAKIPGCLTKETMRIEILICSESQAREPPRIDSA